MSKENIILVGVLLAVISVIVLCVLFWLPADPAQGRFLDVERYYSDDSEQVYSERFIAEVERQPDAERYIAEVVSQPDTERYYDEQSPEIAGPVVGSRLVSTGGYVCDADECKDISSIGFDTNTTTLCGDVNQFALGTGECVAYVPSVTYLPSSVETVYGTDFNNNDLVSISFYDEIFYSTHEANGAPGLMLDLNFSGVENFSSILLKEWFDDNGHEIIVKLWNYVNSSWNTYAVIESREVVEELTISVGDPADHIDVNGLVQLRFEYAGNGNTSYSFFVDYVWLQSGPVVSTQLHDSLVGLNVGNYQHLTNAQKTELIARFSGARTTIGGYNGSGYHWIRTAGGSEPTDLYMAFLGDTSGGVTGVRISPQNNLGIFIDEYGDVGVGKESEGLKFEVSGNALIEGTTVLFNDDEDGLALDVRNFEESEVTVASIDSGGNIATAGSVSASELVLFSGEEEAPVFQVRNFEDEEDTLTLINSSGKYESSRDITTTATLFAKKTVLFTDEEAVNVFEVRNFEESEIVITRISNADGYWSIQDINAKNIFAQNNVSALTFTDRTPAFVGTNKEALTQINNISSKLNTSTSEFEIDHDSLPVFAQAKIPIYSKDCIKREKDSNVCLEYEIIGYSDERSIGAMVTMLVEAVKALSSENELIKTELCKWGSYVWCGA